MKSLEENKTLSYTSDENKTLSKKEKFLKKSLIETQKSLADAYAGLDAVEDPDLIDSYIYELNAAYLRYRVLLRDVKAITSDEVHQTHQTNLTDHFPTVGSDIPSLSDLLPESDIV